MGEDLSAIDSVYNSIESDLGRVQVRDPYNSYKLVQLVFL